MKPDWMQTRMPVYFLAWQNNAARTLISHIGLIFTVFVEITFFNINSEFMAVVEKKCFENMSADNWHYKRD